MNIESIKQMHNRIKEIKKQMITIQKTYSRIPYSYSKDLSVTPLSDNKKNDTVVKNLDSSKADQQINGVNDIKISEEVIKNILTQKRNTGAIDIIDLQRLLKKAITQYEHNTLFNIEE